MSPRLYSVLGRSGSTSKAFKYCWMAPSSSPASDSPIPASCSSSARLLASSVIEGVSAYLHAERIDPPPQNHPRHFCTKRVLSRVCRSAAAGRVRYCRLNDLEDGDGSGYKNGVRKTCQLIQSV